LSILPSGRTLALIPPTVVSAKLIKSSQRAVHSFWPRLVSPMSALSIRLLMTPIINFQFSKRTLNLKKPSLSNIFTSRSTGMKN
jgi:hypothetical protein